MRKVQILKSIYEEFCIDLKEFSFTVAFARVVSKIRIPFLSYADRSSFFWTRIYRYIRKQYGTRIDYKTDCASHDLALSENVIWVMWWQGEEQMPDVIHMCYEQMKRVKGNKKLVLITKDNYTEYVQLPSAIIRKFNAGLISITHLSDVIRCYLLRDHGGLWLDSSIFASNLNINWTEDFYTLSSHGKLENYFSNGSWATFVLYCKYKNSLFMRYMCALYKCYWEEHDRVIVYEMPDYFIRLIYDNSEVVKNQIDRVPDNTGYRLLLGIMNNKYNQESIDKVLKECPLQKLSYKYEVNKEKNGELTNFGHLMNEAI